jgi:hypothetical protein
MALEKSYVNQVTPQQVIKIYAAGGINLTIDQANQILEFMYMLAEIALDIAEEELNKEKLDGSNS